MNELLSAAGGPGVKRRDDAPFAALTQRLQLLGDRSADEHHRQQYHKAVLRPETIASLTNLHRRVLAIDDPEMTGPARKRRGFLK